MKTPGTRRQASGFGLRASGRSGRNALAEAWSLEPEAGHLRRLSRRTGIALVIAFAIVSGCTSTSDSTPASTTNASATSSARQTQRHVSLPDLSSASQSVQSQIRERFTSLTTAVQNADTPTADLAGAYGETGKLLMAAEYLDAAESCFLNAQTLVPTDMRWPYYLGHVSRFKNDPAKGAAWFEQTLRLQPDHVPTLVWLGEMDLAQNKLDEADPLFRKALSLEPRSGAARYGLGRVALARQDYGQAVAELEGALAIAPSASRIHYPLALAYRGRGDRAKAETHLKLRGDVEPSPDDSLMAEVGGLLKNAAAYEVRGQEALDKRQWKEAVINLRKAVEGEPNNAFTRLNLGTALYLTGDAPGALEQFDAAVRLSPALAKAHYSIGVLMEAAGRDRDAIEHFSLAVKSDASYVEARMQLADALRRSGRVKESLPHYAEVIRTSPGISQAVFGEAMALVRLGRYREARDRLSDGMKSYPDQAGFAHAQARLLAAAPDAAVRDGPRAMELMQQLLNQQRTLGLAETMAMTLAELGRFDEAVAWQRDALDTARKNGREDIARRLAENLVLFERYQPCRTPWTDDDPAFRPAPAR
jgi:tetratricopeptide (TPR) repeat protein